MTCYTYILECSNGTYYTGSARCLKSRMRKHIEGLGANHTRKYLPVKLVYIKEFPRIDQAFAFEKQIQGWSRKKKEALIDGNTNELHALSQCQNDSHSRNFQQ